MKRGKAKEGQATFLETFEAGPVRATWSPTQTACEVLWPVWRALWVNPPFCLQWTMYAEGESTFTSSRGCRVDRSGQPEEDGVRAGEHVEVDEDLVNLHAEALFKLGPQQRFA